MKFKELLYMCGIKPRVKKFGFDIVDIEYDDNKTCQWALWKNPKNRNSFPRIKDYAVLKLFLNSGDFAIDIGAHVGDTTLSMGLCVGKDGLVLALEPNPATYRILEANSKLNQDTTHIVPINLAAMHRDGNYVFQYNEPTLMNGGYQKGISRFKHASFFNIEVEGVNLSKMLVRDYPEQLNNLKFIKTDLEGSDYAVFLSIKDIIKQTMPIIQSEINGVMSTTIRSSYIQSLKDLNYYVFSLRSEALESIQDLTQEMINSKETFDIFAIPPSLIGNFKASSFQVFKKKS
jgi:FkbM family methyltransferase